MVSKETLKEIIITNREFILKQVKTIMPRERIQFPQSLNKTVVFYGVRRSGKTFILFDLFKRFADRSFYVDFEDERLESFEAKDFERLKETVLELNPQLIGKELVFLFDEIQNIEGWEKFSRRVTERESIKVFVSGSSSKMMPLEIHTELRGRSWGIEVLPFSFREFLQAKAFDLNDPSLLYRTNKAILKKHFSDYLSWGGFPEVSLTESEFEKRKLLKEYMSAMFFRDMVERFSITNILLLEALTDKLFSSFSLKFSPTAFYKQYKEKFPFSKDLLFKYYKYFFQSMLIYEVKKFSESAYVRMRNPAKIYLVDTGLTRRVTSADTGRLLENMVYLELKRNGFETYYFEGKRECDFIAKKNGDHIPLQVTQEINEGNRKREIEGIVDACRYLDVKKGIVITYDDEDEFQENGIQIKVLPAWKWCISLKDRANTLLS